MGNRTQSVFVVLALLIVILIILWILGLGTPWALLAAIVAFVWKIVVLPILHLILAAIDIVSIF